MELRDVRRSFREAGGQQLEILHGIDLAIYPGEFVAITGPSGAGKSTILNLIGLLENPSSGSLLVNGRDTRTFPPGAMDTLRGETFGFVFQDAHMLPEQTTASNIALGLRTLGLPRRSWPSVVADAAERVGLTHRLAAPARTLSGGERQRAAIARAIAPSPAVLLADEPTGSLDSANGARVIELLKRLNEGGLTVIVVTHDPVVASQASRRIQLVDGTVVADSGSHHRKMAALPEKEIRREIRWPFLEALNSLLLRPLRTVFLIAAFVIGTAGLVAASGVSATASVQVADRISQAALNEVRVGAPAASEVTSWKRSLQSIRHVRSVSLVMEFDPSALPVSSMSPLLGSPAPGVAVSVVDTEDLTSEPLTLVPKRAGPLFDALTGAHLAVLGSSAARALGITQADPSRPIWIAGHRFAVVAIATPTEKGTGLDNRVFVPVGSIQGATGDSYFRVVTDVGYPAAVGDAIPLAVAPAEPGTVQVGVVAELRDLSRGVSGDLGVLIGGVSLILLLLSILGGAAAMSLSVQARVPEVALRRALGASRRYVAGLFLAEGMVLGLAGGLAGAALGSFVVVAIAASQGWSAAMDPLLPLVGIASGFLAGGVTGAVPAVLAARLSPAQAVRA